MIVYCADARLKDVQAAADAAAVTMQREVAADVEPPPRTDPKIAVMNLLQVGKPVWVRLSVDTGTPNGLERQFEAVAAAH